MGVNSLLNPVLLQNILGQLKYLYFNHLSSVKNFEGAMNILTDTGIEKNGKGAIILCFTVSRVPVSRFRCCITAPSHPILMRRRSVARLFMFGVTWSKRFYLVLESKPCSHEHQSSTLVTNHAAPLLEWDDEQDLEKKWDRNG